MVVVVVLCDKSTVVTGWKAGEASRSIRENDCASGNEDEQLEHERSHVTQY